MLHFKILPPFVSPSIVARAISFPLLFAIAFKIKKRVITIAIVGIAIIKRRAIKKRSHESIYKNDTKNEAKELRAKLEER